MELRQLKLVLIFCTLLFALGLFAPCMQIAPRFGELTDLVTMFRPDLERTQSVSIFEGMVGLFAEGKIFIALVVCLFSILFPFWKLAVLWTALLTLQTGGDPVRYLSRIEKLGKFSMVDVFVIALLIVSIKGLPGGTRISIGWGIGAFTLSVLLSMKLTTWLHRLANRGAEEAVVP